MRNNGQSWPSNMVSASIVHTKTWGADQTQRQDSCWSCTQTHRQLKWLGTTNHIRHRRLRSSQFSDQARGQFCHAEDHQTVIEDIPGIHEVVLIPGNKKICRCGWVSLGTEDQKGWEIPWRHRHRLVRNGYLTSLTAFLMIP